MTDKGLTYRDSGVDIDEGDALVERIKPHARRTSRPEVLSGIGGFGGLFEVPKGYREPVMVVGTDGVGTKLKLAFMAGKHDTVGIDLVAMSVNDVVVCGAEPVVFLDYFATSRLDAAEAEQVIKGIAEGCLRAGCALIGGETAELPGFYSRGEYDLAGFCVGVVEKSRILDGKRVKAGDVVIGMASSGLHSNGFSLARKAFESNLGPQLARELLEPTRIYVKDCLALREAVDVHAFAHVTGGGLPGNLPRVLPGGHRALLKYGSWPVPPIFERIQKAGKVADAEMLRTPAGAARFRDRRRRGRARASRARGGRRLVCASAYWPRAPARICRPSWRAAPPGRSRRRSRCWSATSRAPGRWSEPGRPGSRPCCSSTSSSPPATSTIGSWWRCCGGTASSWSASPASCGCSVPCCCRRFRIKY